MRKYAGSQGSKGFTLLELLVVVVIIAVLAALLSPAIASARLSAWRGVSCHSLKSLITGGQQYLGEHEMTFWKYRDDRRELRSTIWWFGLESTSSMLGPEGSRTVDFSQSPLGAYIPAAASCQSDPAFLSFSPRHKPKYANALIGYGYNSELGGGEMGRGVCVNATQIEHPTDIVVFATSAQVNTFQAPASPANPMIEEFCLINRDEVTVHFRYGGKALCAYADGSVREAEMQPGTLDSRMPSANIAKLPLSCFPPAP